MQRKYIIEVTRDGKYLWETEACDTIAQVEYYFNSLLNLGWDVTGCDVTLKYTMPCKTEV